MNNNDQSREFGEEVLKWMTAQACQDVVLRFMGLFDMRAWAEMKQHVTPDLEWQRPDSPFAAWPTCSRLSALRPTTFVCDMS